MNSNTTTAAGTIDLDTIMATLRAEQAEWERTQRNKNGRTVAELRVAFDAVADKANWKDPIRAEVRASDLAATIDAVEWFAGSGLWHQGERTDADGVVWVKVFGPGYYACIGA